LKFNPPTVQIEVPIGNHKIYDNFETKIINSISQQAAKMTKSRKKLPDWLYGKITRGYSKTIQFKLLN
jgi:hypothetical protein